MICGLFSTFDPGLFMGPLSSLSFKWTNLLIIPLFLSWDFYSVKSGYSLSHFWMSALLMKEVKENLSVFAKESFLPLVSVFMLIFLVNLLGLVPFFFSLSSHLSFNLSLSTPLWLLGVMWSLALSVKKFAAHLTPLGSPLMLSPLLVVVESVSVLIRPLTLSVRLMANIMAGHLILNLLASSSYSFLTLSGLLGFEMCVSVIQAYVFMTLLVMYWKESE